jgi:hypothetical protein
MQETYAYAKTLLDVATANPDGRTRALLVGGGIANFTDVAATFKGIIQVSTRNPNCLLRCSDKNREVSSPALSSMSQSCYRACWASHGQIHLHICRR